MARFPQIVLSLVTGISVACLLPSALNAASWDPAAADYSGHKGRTIYVSKLGDNSDGSSWQKAFRTIQTALLAVPDDKGGHRYVQYRQPVPKGFERLGLWPVDLFDRIAPPKPPH